MGKKEKHNKKSLTITKAIAEKIPYNRCFEEEGVFETSEGTFSKAYVIKDLPSQSVKGFNNELLVKKFSHLLNDLPQTMNIQFLIHNRLIPQEAFLKKVLVSPEGKEAELSEWINKYNHVLADNCSIGHNNVKKNKYFVISTKADTPDEAVTTFRMIDEKIKELFASIYGIEVEGMSATARLKVMYSMLNPNKDDFGKKADLRGDGNFNLKDMARLKLTTKDVIAPDSFETNEKSYMVLNGNTYVRTFFITSMPAVLSSNLISDITNISSNMLFSCIYEPVDSKYGFDAASKTVSENTIVRQSNKRDTIKDRRDKAVVKTEVLINQTEEAYFDRNALESFKQSVAVGEKTMLCSFVIALYADDLDILERDTKLLRMSTAKFACQVKPLDYQQLAGFQSVMPLCEMKVDVRRMFTINKLASSPPLNIQEILQRDGLFCGLNSINDNLVLLNRKNNPNLAGIIAGTEHSGKTYQNKREIFNALISTKDRVFIMSDTDEYDGFVTALGGEIVEANDLNVSPFYMVDHYGLINADKYSKCLMLDALFEIWTRSGIQGLGASVDDSEYERMDAISAEVGNLLQSVEEISDVNALLSEIRQNEKDYPFISSLSDRIESYADSDVAPVSEEKRLMLYKIKDLDKKIIFMDFLFNWMISDKQHNITDWLFIDNIDEILSSEQTASFLIDFVTKMNALQDVLTMVIQSSVKLFTDKSTSFRLEDVVNAAGYYKLLNQGAIERKRYSEILNISNSLVNYITSAELGKGIILTSASNYAFDDNFLSEEEQQNSLYKLFKM